MDQNEANQHANNEEGVIRVIVNRIAAVERGIRQVRTLADDLRKNRYFLSRGD